MAGIILLLASVTVVAMVAIPLAVMSEVLGGHNNIHKAFGLGLVALTIWWLVLASQLLGVQ